MNIFIAKTPYHVLLAHSVLLKLKEPEEVDSYLIYTGNDLKSIESIIKRSYWKCIFHFNIQLSPLSLYTRVLTKKWTQDNKLWNKKANIFISDDMNWRNQLLENYLQCKERFLIEDGIGSYYPSKLSFVKMIFRHIVLRILFSGLKLHYGCVSHSIADGYYSINEGAYPWVKKRNNIYNIYPYLKSYLENIAGCKKMDFEENIDLVVLTQPLYEAGLISKKKDIDHHKNLIQPFIKKTKGILIKKHPYEEERIFIERVEALRISAPQATVYSLSDETPAEALLAYTNTSTIIVSPISTALINLKKLNPELQVFYSPLDDNHPISLIFEKSGILKI